MGNFEIRIGVRSALIAAALMMLFESRAYSQAWRVALSPQKQNQNQAATVPPAHGQPFGPVPADEFDKLLDRAIDITGKRLLTAKAPPHSNPHSPWQIFHCILAMRRDCVVRVGTEKANAIDWLSTTEPQFDNQPWLLLTPHGAKFHPYTKKFYFEGHPGQFLALLSHSNLPLDHQFHVQGKVVKMSDLINNTMKEVNTSEEVTWVLWTLQHYLKSDATWVNQANEAWSIERLVQMESAAPVVGAPCGGNHRLFALTRARDKYLQSGGPLRGVWLQADQKIKQHIEIAKSLQNTDGSFSADSYKGPKHTNDVNDRFNTTGHTMEFLSISLPNQRLNENWVRRAVWTLSRELIIHQNTGIDCGPLFHTLDALILYRDRIKPKVVAPPTSSPDPAPEIAKLPLDPKLGTDLKSKPEPTVVLEPPVSVPGNKPVASAPDEVKSSDSTNQPVPFPETVPESKTPETKSNLPAPSAFNTPPNDPGFAKRHAVAAKPPVPKIDPTQLGDVGSPAPATKLGERRLLPPRMTDRGRSSHSIPALLPDSESPIRSIGKNDPTAIRLAEKSSSVHPLADAVLESGSGCGAPAETDEPASALEPANP